MDLGIKVLKLPKFVIETALYDNHKIQPSTHEILSRWLKKTKQPTRSLRQPPCRPEEVRDEPTGSSTEAVGRGSVNTNGTLMSVSFNLKMFEKRKNTKMKEF